MNPKPKTRAQIILSLPILAFILIIIGFIIILERNPDRNQSQLIGQTAPNTILPPIEGGKTPAITNADFQNDHTITVVNFWASWCVPCRAEHPFLMQLKTLDNTQIIGINYKDKPENAQKFLSQLGNPYRKIGADQTGITAIDWGVYGIPETFLIDQNATIRYKHVGPITQTHMQKILAEIKNIRHYQQ